MFKHTFSKPKRWLLYLEHSSSKDPKHSNSRDSEHKCQYCPKKFSKNILLQRHIRLHTDFNRQHVCYVCQYRFSKERHLIDHMRIHVKEGLECPHCKKHFSHASTVIKHLKLCKETMATKGNDSKNLRWKCCVFSKSDFNCRICLILNMIFFCFLSFFLLLLLLFFICFFCFFWGGEKG